MTLYDMHNTSFDWITPKGYHGVWGGANSWIDQQDDQDALFCVFPPNLAYGPIPLVLSPLAFWRQAPSEYCHEDREVGGKGSQLQFPNCICEKEVKRVALYFSQRASYSGHVSTYQSVSGPRSSPIECFIFSIRHPRSSLKATCVFKLRKPEESM